MSLQPWRPASIKPYVRRASPPVEATIPTGSSPGRPERRDSGTRARAAISPIRQTGTFIRKTQPHQ